MATIKKIVKRSDSDLLVEIQAIDSTITAYSYISEEHQVTWSVEPSDRIKARVMSFLEGASFCEWANV